MEEVKMKDLRLLVYISLYSLIIIHPIFILMFFLVQKMGYSIDIARNIKLVTYILLSLPVIGYLIFYKKNQNN
ncbi:hypothetical protein DQF64_03295 [Moraxella bovis]|nr:hypothetical protein DQF64_03295 [Moraxella bovis]